MAFFSNSKLVKLAKSSPKMCPPGLFRLDELRFYGPQGDFAFHEHRNPAVVIREPDEDSALGNENAVAIEHRFHLDRVHRADRGLELFPAVD